MEKETMLVRRGDVVHVRGCARATGVKTTPVVTTPAGTLFCGLCGAEPFRRVPAGSLTAAVLGKTVAVPASGLDAPFDGEVVEVTQFVGVTGRPVTELHFAAVEKLGPVVVRTVDSTVRVEVRS